MTENLLKKYKARFPFGTAVVYNTVMVRKGNGEKRTWEGDYLGTNRSGYVIGWSWISNGVVKKGRYIANTSVFVLEIKHAMLAKVDLVLPFAVRLNRLQPQIHSLPDRLYRLSAAGSEAWKNTPREPNGRWK